MSDISPEVNEIDNSLELPKTIVSKIENYIANGRPELGGRHEAGFFYKGSLGREPGARSGFCGFTSSYGVEVMDHLSADEKKDICGCNSQAERLNAIDNSSTTFRRHGFNILIDKQTGKPYIIDCAFNQFVNKDENGNLSMTGSDIQLNQETDDPVSKTANQLLTNQFTELTPESLASYMILMTQTKVDTKNKFNDLQKLFSDRNKYINCLSALLFKTDNNKRAGNWNGVMNIISVQR